MAVQDQERPAETEQTVEREHRREEHNGHDGNMLTLSGRIEQHYLSPAPEAEPHHPNLFPRTLAVGAWVGMIIGAGLGLLFAYLLLNGIVAPDGWEGLFSLTPTTLYWFGIFTGIALGLLVGGVIALFVADAPPISRAEHWE